MAQVMDQLVKFVTKTRYADLPGETIEYAKVLCLSQIAAMVGGTELPAGKIVAKHVQCQGGTAESGVVGHAFKAPALQAALANATIAHATELEDDAAGGGTTIGTIIPAALTLAQALRSTGKELLESIIVGYDVQVKTAIASRAIRRGIMFFCTGAWGPAVSAAKLLKLDAHQTTMTMGIAASLLGGFDSQTPSMTHFLESGVGAHNGLLAAMLARRGFTGQPDIIEGSPAMHFPGMWGAMGFDSSGLDQLGTLLSDELRLLRIGIKKYGSINITQRLIDGAIGLCTANRISYDEVVRVEVHVAPWFAGFSHYPDPQTTDEARFSIHHLMASVLLTGTVSLHTFGEAALRDPRFAQARRKVDQVVHPERGQILYSNGPDELVIRLRDGSTYVVQCEVTGAGPASADEVISKLRSAAEFSGYLNDEALGRLCELVLHLDELDEVGEIMELLTFGLPARA